jgi:hypothetical protein
MPEDEATHSFEKGDVEALWRLVRNPPRSWRFTWFPGDFEIIGQSLEQTIGVEQAALLREVRAIHDEASLASARHAIEAFVREHPGDSTAISAGLSHVSAEQLLNARAGAERGVAG